MDFNEIIKAAQSVPVFNELISDVVPVGDKVSTATNYSMISERLCDYENGWMLVGDSAYFVDPLFSSGVTFAIGHALSATLAIRCFFDENYSRDEKRDIWTSYSRGWKHIGSSFATVIDQWYHAIANNSPGSMFWRDRASKLSPQLRDQTFQAIVDTAVSPDLLHVLTRGSGNLEDLGTETSASQQTLIGEHAHSTDVLTLESGTQVKKTYSAGVNYNVGNTDGSASPHVRERIASFWRDPVKNVSSLPPLFGKPVPCATIFSPDHESMAVEYMEDVEEGFEVCRLLQEERYSYAQLSSRLSSAQMGLVGQLIVAGLAKSKQSDGISPTRTV
ncbi:MAG: hypothetical protein IPJ88_12700 [Myxococcales bacterium]|nr:MAG: hypothetical protein IPJ88_12700 [Myxococcales bacterium]